MNSILRKFLENWAYFSQKKLPKEFNYKMIGVSKVTSDRNCPGNRKETEK